MLAALLPGLNLLAQPSLGDAADNPGLAWTSGGNAAWVGQTNTTHDGLDAAESGPIIDAQETWLETSVTGPGRVSFWWKVSSDGCCDLLEFMIGGVRQASFGGFWDWQRRSFLVPAGPQTLRWRYSKDLSATYGYDRGWIDQVSYVPSIGPPVISETPTNRIVREGATLTFIALADGEMPISYQWYFNATNAIPGAIGETLTVADAQWPDSGAFTVVASNAAGLATSAPAVLTVVLNPSLGPGGNFYEAVPAAGVEWTNAKAAAELQGGHLATILSAAEDAAVETVRRAYLGEEAWVGGAQEFGQPSSGVGWSWVNNEGVISGTNGGPTYANWLFPEPNDYTGPDSENHLAVGLNNVFGWNDEGAVLQITGYILEHEAQGPPRILTQPRDRLASVGARVVFRVAAVGAPALGYQWFHNGTNQLPSATNALLVLPNAQSAQAGRYTVVVSNALDAVTSQAALLAFPSLIGPTLSDPAMLPATQFRLRFSGQPGGTYTALVSSNIVHWEAIGPAGEISPGQFEFTDTAAASHPARFYRVRLP